MRNDTDTPEHTSPPREVPDSGHHGRAPREYDRSGLYPEDGGKAFRIWALLAWLAGVVVFLAGASALLNVLLVD